MKNRYKAFCSAIGRMLPILQVSDSHLSGASYEWSAPPQSMPGRRGAPRSSRDVHSALQQTVSRSPAGRATAETGQDDARLIISVITILIEMREAGQVRKVRKQRDFARFA